MHKLDGRWHLFFSASVCNPDWGVVLPTLRVYTLAGGAESPLSADYELLGPITPPNFTDGMLDAVCLHSILSLLGCFCSLGNSILGMVFILLNATACNAYRQSLTSTIRLILL